MRGLTYKTHAGSLEPFTSFVKQKAQTFIIGVLNEKMGEFFQRRN
jgi:hypothetical protein